MTDLNKIAEGYITAWNEGFADANSRAELLKAVFTEDVSYRDPLMQGDGHDGSPRRAHRRRASTLCRLPVSR